MPTFVLFLVLLGLAVAARPYVAGWAQYSLLHRFIRSYLLFVGIVVLLGGLFLVVSRMLDGGLDSATTPWPSLLELVVALLVLPIAPATFLTYLLPVGRSETSSRDSAGIADGGSSGRKNQSKDTENDSDSDSGSDSGFDSGGDAGGE